MAVTLLRSQLLTFCNNFFIESLLFSVYSLSTDCTENTVLFSWNNRKCNARIISSICIICWLVSLVNGLRIKLFQRQSYDAANSVCSAFDTLREGNKQAIFSNLNDNANVNRTRLISDAKIQHQKSEVNKMIWMGKCLQKWILFRNFAQTEFIVRWATYSCLTVIVQLAEDHQSVEC